MKTLLQIGIFFLAINSFAQCVICKSLEEADKNPEMVKSF